MQFETILVECLMPNDEVIWWKTLIEDITPQQETAGILAIASVQYEGGLDKKKDRTITPKR